MRLPRAVGLTIILSQLTGNRSACPADGFWPADHALRRGKGLNFVVWPTWCVNDRPQVPACSRWSRRHHRHAGWRCRHYLLLTWPTRPVDRRRQPPECRAAGRRPAGCPTPCCITSAGRLRSGPAATPPASPGSRRRSYIPQDLPSELERAHQHHHGGPTTAARRPGKRQFGALLGTVPGWTPRWPIWPVPGAKPAAPAPSRAQFNLPCWSGAAGHQDGPILAPGRHPEDRRRPRRSSSTARFAQNADKTFRHRPR